LEIVVRQQVLRWFRVALWLTPVLVLCGWVGNSALPSPAAKEEAGLLCSAAPSPTRAAPPRPALLRKVRTNPGEPVQTMPITLPPSSQSPPGSKMSMSDFGAQLAG